MNFDLVSVAAVTATAVAGFVGGVTRERTNREARFDKRVDERLEQLEKQVEECRQRDNEVVILRMGMRMIVPELLRREPMNPVLKQVASALSALPEGGDTMDDLVEKLDQVLGTYERKDEE